MIYSHVDNKLQLPDQNGYFIQLLRVDPDELGLVREDRVHVLRYIVMGHCFMRFDRTMADKQGSWTPTYCTDEDSAHQMLREHLKIDTEVHPDYNPQTTTTLVCELTFGLTEGDLLAIDRKLPKGPDGRWRPCHWTENHLGKPKIDATARTAVMAGGSD